MNLTLLVGEISALSPSLRQPVIFIAGFGASGKTTLCRQLHNGFPGSAVIASDWFLHDSSQRRKEKIARGEIPENSISWYDWNALISCINMLIQIGQYHLSNGWNQTMGEKDFNCKLEINHETFAPIIVDGIYLLHPEISQHADLTVCWTRHLKLSYSAAGRATSADRPLNTWRKKPNGPENTIFPILKSIEIKRILL